MSLKCELVESFTVEPSNCWDKSMLYSKSQSLLGQGLIVYLAVNFEGSPLNSYKVVISNAKFPKCNL